MTLRLQEFVDLLSYNTFGLPAKARWFAELFSEEDVWRAHGMAKNLGLPVYFLGGGSNVLLASDINALVLKISIPGMQIVPSDESPEILWLEAQAGELWQDAVAYSLEQGFAGLENLSLIPGTVGAAPVQNIGAYGVELSEVLHSLTVFDWKEGRTYELACAECNFAYRDSLFKADPGRWLILKVRLRLYSDLQKLHLDYGAIRSELLARGIDHPTPKDVGDVVCTIRQARLPDPKVLGNAGSFFKNPVITAEQAEQLRAKYPKVVCYPQTDGRVKLAAAWLIDQAGWKGFREGDAGVHRQQALVLVNYGQATGAEILRLARRIQEDVVQKFGVALEMEPVVF